MASGGPGKYPSWIRHMLCPYWEILREGSSPATRGQTSAISTNPRMECVQRHDFMQVPQKCYCPASSSKRRGWTVNRSLTDIRLKKRIAQFTVELDPLY